MTFANAGTLGVVPGKRDELVAHLTQRSDTLKQIGCLAYEVGSATTTSTRCSSWNYGTAPKRIKLRSPCPRSKHL
jgi:quinol monooxygenase YgiN